MITKSALALLVLAAGIASLPAQTPDEAQRVRMVAELIKKRQAFARAGKTPEFQASDAEIKRHPAPVDADPASLARHLVGKWHSPRHDYLYRPDGTWIMLPADPDSPHGRWHFTGNQIEETTVAQGTPGGTSRCTVILLTDKNYVFTDGQDVFYETRLKP